MLTCGNSIRLTPAESERLESFGFDLNGVHTRDQFARATEVWALTMADIRPGFLNAVARLKEEYERQSKENEVAAEQLPHDGAD